MGFCEGCFQKQQTIDRLQEEIQSLKAKLKYRTERAQAGYFGAATPSSKQPVKRNSAPPEQKKRGGAAPGHPGYGRKAVAAAAADRVTPISIGEECPDCGGRLEDKGFRERTVIDRVPVRAEKVVYRCEKKWCPHCRKSV